jgi:membrane associated rhomboid family serine protease
VSEPRFGERHDEDPSVCYRHPERQSWVLCQRCGRTICPECQILAPVGVQCPECVREAGGSVQWTPANTRPVAKRAAARRAPRASRASASETASSRAGTTGWINLRLRPDGETPPLSWVFAGALVVLWLIGLFTSNLPFSLLAADPSVAWQVWRYATAPFATISQFSLFGILGIVISLFFWLLIAPRAEQTLGRMRFLLVFAVAAVVGSSAMVIAGGTAFGFGAALFGVFGAYAVLVWSYPPARMQIIGVLVINLIINLYVGGGVSLPYLVGGAIAGAGTTYLLQFYEQRARANQSTPYLIIGGVAAALVAIAIFVNVARF